MLKRSRIQMTMQRATKGQSAQFSQELDDPGDQTTAGGIDISWDAWLEMGKPLDLTVQITPGTIEDLEASDAEIERG